MKTYTEAKGPGATSLDPATAVQIAEAIVKAAKRAGFQLPIILLPRH